MTRLIRGVGWTLITFGVIVLLYVVYLLWFTGLETQREQRDLAEEWSLTVPDNPVDHDTEAPELPEDEPIEVGDAYAVLWFERDGQFIISDEPIYVVEGVDLVTLRRGPGHYPESDRPGGEGNLAIAGHRTTYGAPFWSLDVLEEGDTIHLVDRQGREWVYAYVEQRIVQPTELWVVGDDPLGSGAPMITLTTCHPRYSDAQRLIAWGELLGDPIASTAEEGDRDEIAES